VFIDFLPLLLVNMAGGLLALACYSAGPFNKPQANHWAPAFAAPGLIATIGGFFLIFNYPLPGPYNVAFGETSVALGVLFLGAAWSISRGWPLMPLGIYAIFPAIIAVVTGIRIMHLGLTQSPVLAGSGFILTGASGLLLAPATWWSFLRPLRWPAVLLLLVATVLWMVVGVLGYWQHLEHFHGWKPLIFQTP
jgi:putative membrane protein